MPDLLYHIGQLSLHPRRQLMAGDTPVPLGRKALELLTVLAEAEGNLVTKDELMTAVWPDVTVEENALQVHVAALRKAMGDEAEQLLTVRSLGYRLANCGSRAQPCLDPSPKAVAILSFMNLTGNQDLDFLGDSIADELINCLTQSPALKVASRTSSFAFKGHDEDARRIARDLDVSFIVEGSVRKAGERIRITAQLVDAETGFHIWSENFDRGFGDVLVLEDELGQIIADQVQGLILGELNAKAHVRLRLAVPC